MKYLFILKNHIKRFIVNSNDDAIMSFYDFKQFLTRIMSLEGGNLLMTVKII